MPGPPASQPTVFVIPLCRFLYRQRISFGPGRIRLVPVESDGADERTPPGLVGEYAQSTLARERLFEYFSSSYGIPVLIYPLNYTIDLRYGLLQDIGEKVVRGKSIDLSMGFANVICQASAGSLPRNLPLELGKDS